MARRKTLSTRTMTRIAARRAGMFNQPGYRQGVQTSRGIAAWFFGILGLFLTLASAGAALPITALMMAPLAVKLFGR